MDLVWLARNVATSWRYRGGWADFPARLYLDYSHRLPGFIRKDELIISFRYPAPVGTVKLVIRTNAGSDAFIHSEVFEHNYYDLGLDYEPKTILDLGANTGLTSVYFGRRFPNAELASVEPMPGNLRVLRRNLELNGVQATVLACAADATDGKVLMEIASRDYGHRVAGSEWRAGAEHLEVPALSVPSILRRLGWARIGLLKVDIEGHERVLLSTNETWLSLVDALCIECHDGYGERDLQQLANRYQFGAPKLLPGVWLMRRSGNLLMTNDQREC